jgi:hypothetical protein
MTSVFGQNFTVEVQAFRQVEVKPRIGIATHVPLRLPEVIERALANDPDLAISRIQLQEAGYLIRSAQGYYDPLVGMRGTAPHGPACCVAAWRDRQRQAGYYRSELHSPVERHQFVRWNLCAELEQFSPNHG